MSALVYYNKVMKDMGDAITPEAVALVHLGCVLVEIRDVLERSINTTPLPDPSDFSRCEDEADSAYMGCDRDPSKM